MYNHTTDTTLWVPHSAVLMRAQQTPGPPSGLAAEQAIFLQAVTELAAQRPAHRRTRPKIWSRLRSRLTQLPV